MDNECQRNDRATFLPEYSVSIGAQAGLSRQAV